MTKAIRSVKAQAEEYAMESATAIAATIPNYVYVTYIHAGAEQVWKALTDADVTAQYWDHANVSDWERGSTWEHRRNGTGAVDVVGRVLVTARTGHALPTAPWDLAMAHADR